MSNLLVITVLAVVGFQVVRHVGRKVLKSGNEGSWRLSAAKSDRAGTHAFSGQCMARIADKDFSEDV